MATLISPVKHSVGKNFRKDIRTVEYKEYNFEPNVPVNDLPDEFADSLRATYPDKYFIPEEFKSVPIDEENEEIPSLEKLERTDLHELKKIADFEGIKYGQNISAKTLAKRIHEHNLAPDKDTAETDEAVPEGA